MPGEQEKHVGALDAVRDLGEKRLQDRARALPLAGQEPQSSSLETPTAIRARVVRGVSAAASSASSAAVALAPRPAASSLASSSSRATEASGSSAASARWRARSSRSETASASARCAERRAERDACS